MVLYMLASFCFISCGQQKNDSKQIKKSFYFWRTIFSLSENEKAVLDSLDIEELYVRYFDVDLVSKDQVAAPLSPVYFKEIPTFDIIPVIFIVNRTLMHVDDKDIHSLAKNIVLKIRAINNSISLESSQIQIDCDWTEATRFNYFLLLRTIRSMIDKKVILSSTIRLHQVKFVKQTGIPPVERGMLMVYNVGKIGDIKTNNSIFDSAIISQYTDELENYPLD